jgi:hypothetical protein
LPRLSLSMTSAKGFDNTWHLPRALTIHDICQGYHYPWHLPRALTIHDICQGLWQSMTFAKVITIHDICQGYHNPWHLPRALTIHDICQGYHNPWHLPSTTYIVTLFHAFLCTGRNVLVCSWGPGSKPETSLPNLVPMGQGGTFLFGQSRFQAVTTWMIIGHHILVPPVPVLAIILSLPVPQ